MIQSKSQSKPTALSHYLLMAMVALLIIFSAGCKSKKQAGDISDADAEKAKMEQEARQRELEAERRRAEEERLAREKARAEAEAAAAAANKPENKLADYFQAIANAPTTSSANSSINEALTMFSSPDAPVLIVISQSGSQKDYDRPTTIKEYLNYLKDQKKNVNRISDLQFDASGKIKEVELSK
ncbi:nucleoid-structuring protein H-NS [Fulvivirga maritima]|uniref:nucleoid-structuring protein H-NS n=1 Tax=Fulvivirga maritima TaxID=2904247 RepID=UPI001F1A4A8B|nr:nucleoid-structuring protein H-NS [Fulvivirga maritima]UII29156.1 nucleoid-structuring protein H-NS [Fulvivirga maritima]